VKSGCFRHHACEISGFRREVDKKSAFLGHYAAIVVIFTDNGGQVEESETFGFLNPEDGIDSLSRNVGKKLPLLVA